ncbi:hypothetical protein WN72_24600 [Bradyrhizobium arachidis]|uniref:Uncharacterized protein n=2 Tax=Bradyrhizobium arachidis TaxID=858423 RepID=A0AAE7TIC1_9BRAD|nr:hypothetical protein WN72_24600 [Bradyrhizobium arachidis]
MAFAYLANFFMVAIETKRDRVYEHPYIRDNAESRRMRRFNRISHFVSFLFGLASLALFIAGMWTTGSKVTQLIESRTVSKAVGQ